MKGNKRLFYEYILLNHFVIMYLIENLKSIKINYKI